MIHHSPTILSDTIFFPYQFIFVSINDLNSFQSATLTWTSYDLMNRNRRWDLPILHGHCEQLLKCITNGRLNILIVMHTIRLRFWRFQLRYGSPTKYSIDADYQLIIQWFHSAYDKLWWFSMLFGYRQYSIVFVNFHFAFILNISSYSFCFCLCWTATNK